MRESRFAFGCASIVWMMFIFWLSSLPELKSSLPSAWDLIARKFAHIAEYLILYFLFSRTFSGQRAKEIALFFSVLYAAGDEWHQAAVFGRHASSIDLGIDSLGVLLGYVLKKPHRR